MLPIDQLELNPAQMRRLEALRATYGTVTSKKPKALTARVHRLTVLTHLSTVSSATAEEVGNALGTTKDTAYRYLRVLRKNGFVSNMPRGRALQDPKAKPTKKWWITGSGLTEMHRLRAKKEAL